MGRWGTEKRRRLASRGSESEKHDGGYAKLRRAIRVVGRRLRCGILRGKGEEDVGKWGGVDGAVLASGEVGRGEIVGALILASNDSGVEGGSDQWVPHVRGKEGGGAAGLAGPVCWAALAPDWPSQTVSFFYSDSFLIFCFMICFITLSFELQMHSNKFLKFCKIQHSKKQVLMIKINFQQYLVCLANRTLFGYSQNRNRIRNKPLKLQRTNSIKHNI
jgi:hypothetical protein